ncbi:MAG: hypothetical protein OHM77_07315 [Candidatus Nitricoxidivorans perseverans]|uniref:DNA-binding protein n=1 Tax=Candidatus Nitricoxidivorans perseverans TaxID=2975601 RepID=A0AA49FIZ9_9PROT|nr:MAG: hypothetical protein OHM77_07315 [Candidatus Nitricoxidivorans perseverans]
MKKVAINEHELAERWGLSPKTLQRWRCEGRPSRSHSMFPSANGMRARTGSGLLRLKMTGIFP